MRTPSCALVRAYIHSVPLSAIARAFRDPISRCIPRALLKGERAPPISADIEMSYLAAGLLVHRYREGGREGRGRKLGKSTFDTAGGKQTDVRGQKQPCTCISMPARLVLWPLVRLCKQETAPNLFSRPHCLREKMNLSRCPLALLLL